MLHPSQSRPSIVVPGATPSELRAAERWLTSLTRLPRFAHHPACGYWSNHLIRVGSVPLCLGCSCMAVGMVIGLVAVYPLLVTAVGPLTLFAMGVLCYVPTIAQIYVQRYVFKMAARSALGIGVVLALGAALFGHSWASVGAAWNLLFLLIFVGLLVGTLRWRARRLDIPCQRCPEGRFPFCSWRLAPMSEAVTRHERGESDLPQTLMAFVQVVVLENTRKPGDGTGVVQFVNVEHCETLT